MVLVYNTFVLSENLKQEKRVESKNSRKYKATPQSPDIAGKGVLGLIHPAPLYDQFGFFAEIRFLCVAV